ncbi:SPOR domain-containing protein [Sphingomonas sp.]|uniref:SPOR domain-containing protein n=1 Tax=Sphingomonas sp. TaxID=28214 RepID=UPI0035BC7D72
MRSTMFLIGLSVALLAIAPVHAQEVVQPLPGTTDADALAADMRRLAANPRDVDALVDAAHLSLRLDDMRAAAALLARAENVDPRNARVKAGQGSILVQSERPGQALRYFAQAESLGLDARMFAGDRALAYDLVGEQDRAQRDYRTALRDHPQDDETLRRYALSLGISGQRAQALALLDPMIRRSDRAAWRAQAFVLAMTGDVGGASRIAATMMPGGAAGLSAFFERLPTLPATDRAFAVHFGEVRATPERLADARLTPALSPLAREPGTATLLASNAVPAPPARRNRRGRDTQVAAVQSPPATGGYRTPLPTPATLVANARTMPSPAVQANTPSTRPAPVIAERPPLASVLTAATLPSRVDVSPGKSAEPAATMRVPAVVAAISVPSTDVGASSTPSATPPPTVIATAMPERGPVVAERVMNPEPQPVRTAELPPSTVARAAPPPVALTRPAPSRAVASSRVSEDSILARIVAGLSIPASELGVEPPPRPAPVGAAAATPAERPAVVATATPLPSRPAPSRPDPAIAAKAETDRLAAEKLATAKATADKRAADRKAVADRKALAEKKAAAEKKAIADKEVAEAKKLARANPERIWVQVAGGAYEGDLAKAFATVKAKAPTVFGSRQAWTTPLRATNRVLAGPFKTDAEARGFVNDLKKQGVSAFTFTSDPGQPVKRLGEK